MNTKQLRQKILDLAIRGKLVPQDPTDEPASVLLERIREEKERLIKEGKIKRSKTDSTVLRGGDKSHYGQLPPGWEWAQLGSIVNDIATGPFGTMLHKSDYIFDGIPMINPQHIADGNIVPSEKITVNQDTAIRLNSYRLSTDDIIIARRGEMGRCAVVTRLQNGWLCGTGCFILRHNANIDSQFLAMMIKSEQVVKFLSSNSIGATMSNLNHSILNQVVIPIPPITEQYRIVASIGSAFSIIDEIERNKADLQTAVTVAKSKILSLAIRGKLVPQDPNDEPASVLLERIRAEREKLGKIKRSKGESASIRSDDNSYYAGLPKSWTWARVINVCEPQESKLPTGDQFSYIDIDAIDNKRHQVAEAKTLLTSRAPSRAAKGVRAGDTLFSMVRPYLQNIALVTEELNGCIASTGFYVCRPIQEIINPEYLYTFFVSDYAINGISAYMRGDNSPSIRKGDMDNFGVPIPPLAEQQRIVTAINATFEQLDSIAATLT